MWSPNEWFDSKLEIQNLWLDQLSEWWCFYTSVSRTCVNVLYTSLVCVQASVGGEGGGVSKTYAPRHMAMFFMGCGCNAVCTCNKITFVGYDKWAWLSFFFFQFLCIILICGCCIDLWHLWPLDFWCGMGCTCANKPVWNNWGLCLYLNRNAQDVFYIFMSS